MSLDRVTEELIGELKGLRFGPPVSHVYNPLEYARAPYREYLRRFGRRPRPVVLLGMNPGPWGMAQTGVPFGEIGAVRDWMGIEAAVGIPARPHPKRPVAGFACSRREVSGQRLWGWARSHFGAAENFFEANYCPMMVRPESGSNLTPDKLKASQAKPLFAVCDRALRRTVEALAPAHVVGIGRFAAERARVALEGLDVAIGAATHPSPANPRANRGWEALITAELNAMGIEV